MATKITTKGQVTIPADIRNSFNLKSGDELDFFVQGNVIICKPVKTIQIAKVDEWFFSAENQERINQGGEDIKNKKIKKFDNAKDALEWLKS